MERCSCGNAARYNSTMCSACEDLQSREVYIENALDSAQDIDDLKEFIREYLL